MQIIPVLADRPKKNGMYSINIRIYLNGSRAFLPTGFEASEFPVKKNHGIDPKYVNDKVAYKVSQVTTFVHENPKMKAKRVVDYFKGKTSALTVLDYFDIVIREAKTEGNKRNYEIAKARFSEFGDMEIASLDLAALREYENFLSGRSKNTISNYMRALRAVYNRADEDLEFTKHAFKRFKISSEKGTPKALNIEQIQNLYRCDHKYARFFVLQFLLGGINARDIIKGDWKIMTGRFEVRRSKVKDAKISILATWEIRKLLKEVEIESDYDKIKSRISNIDRSLKIRAKKLKLPHVNTSTARYSFATISRDMGFDESTIGEMMGHQRKSITSGYMVPDYRRRDEVTRRLVGMFKN